MLEWLLASVDATRPHDVSFLVSWHGRLMVLGWGVCAPMGVAVARYLKVTPGQNWPEELDNVFWWRMHLVLQITTLVAAALALALILLREDRSWPLHAVLGWVVVVGLAAQATSGLLRGTKGGPTDPAPDGSLDGDHFLMTPRRRAFEVFHKSVGYGLLLLAAVTIFLGLWQVNAPRWMLVALPCYWLALLAGLNIYTRRIPRVSTYEAIWGPDKSLPGNR